MNKINFNKLLRIAVGSSLSFGLCGLLGLKYSASAAVITLLSIQDTKKDTVTDVFKRCSSYILSVLMAFVLYNTIGYNFIAFGIFMAFLVGVSYIMDWSGTLSSSTVVTTHFLLEKSFALDFVFDEVQLLFVGTAIALLSNMLVQDQTKTVKRETEYIDSDFRSILIKTANYIAGEYEFDNEEFNLIKSKIDVAHERALDNIHNIFFDDSHYSLDYIEMRREQVHTVERIHFNLEQIISDMPMKEDIKALIVNLAEGIHNRRLYDENHKRVLSAISKFNAMNLPKSKHEFQIMAKLSDVLNEIDYFAKLNSDFINTLSPNQLIRYWQEGN